MAEQLNTRELLSNLYRRTQELHQRKHGPQGTASYISPQFTLADAVAFNRERPYRDVELKDHVQQHGLPVKLQWWEDSTHSPGNPLYGISVTPRPPVGNEREFPIMFTHEGYAKRMGHHPGTKATPYHISIGKQNDYTEPWQLNHIAWLKDRYREPFDYLLRTQRPGGGFSADLDEDDIVYRDIHNLHRTGSYYYKPIHVSL